MKNVSTPDAFAGGEYDVARMPMSLGAASIVYFVLVFFLSPMLFDAFGRSFSKTLPIVVAVEIGGLILAWAGVRRDQNKFPAKSALILHIGGILSILVPVAGFFFILNR